LHPLAVLVLTIAGGALFGAVGLILAAPLASAIVRISADLSAARSDSAAAPPGSPPQEAKKANLDIQGRPATP
jgi:predicted PurR-regulated permease PerM